MMDGVSGLGLAGIIDMCFLYTLIIKPMQNKKEKGEIMTKKYKMTRMVRNVRLTIKRK